VNHLSRLPEDQPGCTCWAAPSQDHKFWCGLVTPDLVPGYGSTADGLADAADQARLDSR
jgi:hypothetical protein